MKRFYLAVILTGLFFSSFAQSKLNVDSIIDAVEISRKFDLGLGFGLDYGGFFGVKISGVPVDHLLVFGSLGYQPAGLGWNLGVAGHLFPKTAKHGVRPYIKAMYGTNASSYVDGAPEYNEIFYGATLGLGVEFRFGRFKNNGINFDVNYPFRDEDFYDLLDELKADPRIDVYSEPGAITISIGYHFEF